MGAPTIPLTLQPEGYLEKKATPSKSLAHKGLTPIPEDKTLIRKMGPQNMQRFPHGKKEIQRVKT